MSEATCARPLRKQRHLRIAAAFALASAALALPASAAPATAAAHAVQIVPPANSATPIPTGFAPGTGYLEPAGHYFARPQGSQVRYLDNGIVLAYGAGIAVSEWKTQAAQGHWLRRRAEDAGRHAVDNAGPTWFDPASHGWRRLPLPPECGTETRYLHTMTAMADGNVLIAGGLCDRPAADGAHLPYAPYAALSLWNAATHRWLPAPPLAQARLFHSATAMPDGGVLLIGGESDPALAEASSEPVLASVERFGSGKVGPMPPLNVARAKHAALALPGARVLVTGGFDATGHAIAAAELFDPAAGAWQLLSPMHVARHSHTATLLDDGRVLVAGGIGADDKMLDSTEIWNPERQAWTMGPALPIAMYGHAAAKLASGQVMVAGGGWLPGGGKSLPWAWTWDTQEEDWELAAQATLADDTEMSSPVTLVPHANGSVLVFTNASILRWVPAALQAVLARNVYISGDLATGPLAEPEAPRVPVAAPVPPRSLQPRASAMPGNLAWLLLALAVPPAGYALLQLRRRRSPLAEVD